MSSSKFASRCPTPEIVKKLKLTGFRVVDYGYYQRYSFHFIRDQFCEIDEKEGLCLKVSNEY